MKTQEQVLAAVKAGRGSQTLDGRDYGRLASFFPDSDLGTFGYERNEGVMREPTPWTEENIKGQLADDVAFGFDKALHQRGISAGTMYEVVKMWMWVLDDPLEYHNSYAQYGLPLFKAVAIKYDLPNPIGDDDGDEARYSSGGH